MSTVLVIDDDAALVDVVAETLALEGHRVIGALNGAAGLSELQNTSPDLILLDVNMPVLDGPSTLRFIRAGVGSDQLKVVLMTADHHALQTLWPSVDGVLRKPFDVETLVELVRRFVPDPKA